MTTRNVNSSCEVIWISRQDDIAIDALFKSQVQSVTSIPDAFNMLEGTGALWLADGTAINASDRTGDYHFPDGSGYSDVINCQWNKDLSSPAGVFAVQVKPRVAWDHYIKPGDVFIIFMDDDRQYGFGTRSNGTLITVGIVDRVARTTMVDGNGATVEVISINGRDLGMIFQETQTVFDPTLAVLDQEMLNAEYITQTSEDQVSALSPVETVYRLLDLIYNQNATGSEMIGAQWALPSAPKDATGRPVSLLSLINIIEFTQRPMFGYAITQPFGVAQAGNVWTLLESYANRTVNEFFVDVRDIDSANLQSIRFQGDQARNYVAADDELNQDKLAQRIAETRVFNQSWIEGVRDFDNPSVPVPCLVHRQMPYDLDAFMNLPYIDVDHTDVFEVDVGAAAHEVANYFEVHFPDIPELNQELMWGIKINMRSLARFGIRRMEAETRYPFTTSKLSTEFGDGGASDFTQAFAMYVGLLSTWYATQETLLNGSMTCRFMPKVRVGTRIRFRRVDGEFFHYYVQAVNHTFSVQPGASRTTLTLVRGFQEGSNTLASNLIWRPGFRARDLTKENIKRMREENIVLRVFDLVTSIGKETPSPGSVIRERDYFDGEAIPEALLKYVRVKRIGVDAK